MDDRHADGPDRKGVGTKRPSLHLSRRAAATVAAGAVVLGFAGWAFAEGEVPLISSSSPDSSTSTTVAATAASPGASTDNVAVASNTKDGKSVFALSLKIVRTDADTVDATNAAVAVASCNDCQTVAIAIEGVLVMGDPSTFDPTNLALAINSDCSNCQTLATAYQDVVQYDTKVRITGAGRKQIADIRKDLDSLRNSGLDIVAIQQRVNEDAGKFLAVLRNEVVPIGKGAKDATTTSSTTTTTVAGATSPTTATTAPTTSTTEPATSSTTSPSSTSSTVAAP